VVSAIFIQKIKDASNAGIFFYGNPDRAIPEVRQRVVWAWLAASREYTERAVNHVGPHATIRLRGNQRGEMKITRTRLNTDAEKEINNHQNKPHRPHDTMTHKMNFKLVVGLSRNKQAVAETRSTQI
jgi:hypothetical protein